MPVLKMWGNSAAVRIPASILEASRLAVDEAVELRAEAGRIIIEPVRPHYEINELVAAITPENQHALDAHSQAVGAERIEW